MTASQQPADWTQYISHKDHQLETSMSFLGWTLKGKIDGAKWLGDEGNHCKVLKTTELLC